MRIWPLTIRSFVTHSRCMNNRSRLWIFGFAALTALALSSGCAATTHPTTSVALGTAARSATLDELAEVPGPLSAETITAATWEVDRSGLINLDHPKARAAHLADGPEPIALLVHVIHHPERGTYLIDSGVERAFVGAPDEALIHGIFGSLAHIDKLKVHRTTDSILANEAKDLRGVFLTHLHLDHVLGLRDVPAATPIFVGAGDAHAKSMMNLFTRGIFNAALEGKGAIQEVSFRPDPEGSLAGIIDVFGDASLFALSVPGHTRGSMAFMARTTTGTVLFTGDACHTAWGWNNGVGPGTFSEDVAASDLALRRLQRFAAKHPGMQIRLGHQTLGQ